MKTHVLFIWDPRPELKGFLRKSLDQFPDIDLIFPEPADEEQILQESSKADIIVGWRPSEKLLDTAKNLKLFINPGAGVQHQIDRFKKLNTKRSVILVNGHGNSYFTAQHAVALLLALSNKVIPHHNWMKEGKWRLGDKEAASEPLRGKKIGLLGYGAVNRKVHQFLKGFDLDFAALKLKWDHEPEEIIPYTPEQLNEFLKEIDVLIIAIPQTSKTVDLIRFDQLKLLGSQGLLIQLSRGVIINEKDLFTALESKQIAGAAIDVWYNYKPEPGIQGRRYPFSYPFNQLENVILSPHRAASPFSDLKRWEEVIENITRLHLGRKDFLNIVDLEREY
ncbi:NAD(P)-dependent oxidoreductase [Candidatus Cloacimonadota bacterium]